MMFVAEELIFDVTQEADGGFCAECLTEPIFTQADSWDELRASVLDAESGVRRNGDAVWKRGLCLIRSL